MLRFNSIKIMLSVGLLIISLSAYAEELKLKTVSATGRGQVSIPQTVATVLLSINETGKTAKEAQEKTRVKSAKLLKALATAKTISTETNSVTVRPVWSYANNRSTITGYDSSYTVKVKSSIDNAGGIIDLAINSGASIVNEPQLSASDQATVSAQNEAIKLATIDARHRAEAALSAVGLKAKMINQITVQNSANDRVYPVAYAMKANDMRTNAAPATEIVPGNDIVSAEVSISIDY